MKKVFAMILALVMVLSLVACGQKAPADDAVSDEAAPSAPADMPEEAPQDAPADEPIAPEEEAPAEAVFGNLGYTVIFQEIDWSSKYTDLDSGTIDCVWNGFTCNTADDDGILRSEKVDFSYNYMENRQVIIAKADSGITSAADLNGKLAAVESGSRARPTPPPSKVSPLRAS